MEKVDGLDRRVMLRLNDRVRARRSRLAMKRAATYLASIVAAGLATWATRQPDVAEMVWIAFATSIAGSIAGTGATLIFFESASVDDAASDLRRFAEAAKSGKIEAARLHAAGSDASTAPRPSKRRASTGGA
ncbi:MAG TPA: hypothetical protein VHD62_08520 [Opitutaceae bacterium]|nr:hypothetical protein [Opitutaceae bacterium]